MFAGQSLFPSLIIFITLFFIPGYSYSVDAPVKVNQIKFGRENILGLDDWIEIAIELEGGRNPQSESVNPEFVNNINVSLSLCYKINTGAVRGYHYYQAEAAIISLQRGKKKTGYFYLPPEIIQRDRLNLRPYAYLVELKLNDVPLAVERDNISSNLFDSTQLFNFKARVASDAVKNSGILMPIYHTPFYNLRDKLEVSPAFFRKTN